MHKKITAVLLAGVMLLFAGCGNKTAVASAEIDDATVFDEENEEFSGEYDAEILEFDEDMAASKLSVSLFEEVCADHPRRGKDRVPGFRLDGRGGAPAPAENH